MPRVIAEPCVDVKEAQCVEVCPVGAISSKDSEPQFYINPDECIDCGACESVCPVSAIFPDDELPEKWESFKAKNEEFFK